MGAKRYNQFTEELRALFGCRVQRISVDAGFTCPNRDGTAGSDGCIYCSSRGAGAPGIARGRSVAEQLEVDKAFLARRYHAQKFLAYFQAFSNTYGPVEQLQALYDEALAVPDIVGLIVGTRPDCLPPAVFDLLAGYAQRTYFWLELGLQSSHDRSLAWIGRGHDAASFSAAAREASCRGIRVCAHVILGLPGESRAEMLATADYLNSLRVAGVKLHHLHVLKETELARRYEKGDVALLNEDDYVGLVCDFLERLAPNVLVQRLVGDGSRDLIAPRWNKLALLNAIDTELKRRGTRQGGRWQAGEW
ncbi:TIGR01212 family radical SAM protein [Geobacter argillaceus]|nr:TIGR01212 family radical SAM protein [Geobacter argillaceus]